MCSQTRLTLIIIALFTANMVENIILNNNVIAVVKSEALQNRAIEGEGRCYKLELPRGFGDSDE